MQRHHEAMLAGDVPAAMKIREEAHELALKVNGGDAGICAGPDAPAYVLERATAAPAGTVPQLGQTGEFTINVGNMPVRIEQDGMFGVGAMHMTWPGFSAHAVDYQWPFLSETGYRSFIGVHADMVPGITPDVFARRMIEAYVAKECKGKLRKIERSYVEREMARRAEKENHSDRGRIYDGYQTNEIRPYPYSGVVREGPTCSTWCGAYTSAD
jgi:hypothetical protein